MGKGNEPRPIADYKIGDELFRYIVCGGVFRYIVLGRRDYSDSVQLEVECQTCSHGWKCRLLLAQDDYGKIIEVHMLNDCEEDRQRHWHGNEGLHFWPTAEEAKQEQIRRLIRNAEDAVNKAKDALGAAERRRDELKDLANPATQEARHDER